MKRTLLLPRRQQSKQRSFCKGGVQTRPYSVCSCSILALAVFVFWFFYFDPETNFTTRLGPFATRTQCAAFRDDLKAAASPALYFSACWVSD